MVARPWVRYAVLAAVSSALLADAFAAEPESVLQLKDRIGLDPYNWALFNELGLEYHRLRWYDEAIAAFRQALAVHGMSRQLKAEELQKAARKEEVEVFNKQAELARKQRESEAAAQLVGSLFGGLGGLGSLGGGMNNLAAGIMAETAGGMAQAAIIQGSADAVLTKDVGTLSEVQAHREVAGILHNLGRSQYARQYFSDAILSFDEARRTDPALVAAAYWTGEANYQQGRFAQAIEGLFAFHTVANPPNRPEVLLRAATAYRGLGMDAEARRCVDAARRPYEKVLAAQAEDPVALKALGDLSAGWDDAQAALSYYRRYLVLQPEDAAVRLAAAAAAYNSGAYDAATGELDQLNPDAVPGHIATFAAYMRGLLLLDLGRTHEASSAFEQAAARNTLDPPPPHVVAAKALGDPAAGIAWLEREVFSNPFSPSACANVYRLGRALQVRGDASKAMELYIRCLAVQPAYGPAQRALEALRVQQETNSAAAEQRGDALAAERKHAEAATAYAEAWRLTSNERRTALQAKIDRCVAALDTPPPATADGLRHFLRGNAALKTENRAPADLARAIAEYRWAVHECPWDPSFQKHLAVAYMLNGQYQAADACLRSFLAARPRSTDAKDALDALYRAEFLLESQRATLAALCPER